MGGIEPMTFELAFAAPAAGAWWYGSAPKVWRPRVPSAASGLPRIFSSPLRLGVVHPRRLDASAHWHSARLLHELFVIRLVPSLCNSWWTALSAMALGKKKK